MATLELPVKVEEAELDAELDRVEVKHWYCCMPLAGVKYYTYEDQPTPVERIKRPAKGEQLERLIDCGGLKGSVGVATLNHSGVTNWF